MFHRYDSKTVPAEKFAEMLDAADADDRDWIDRRTLPRFVVLDEFANDRDVDAGLRWLLECIADRSRDEHRRGIDGYDLIDAANAFDLKLGNVHMTETRGEAIVEVDYEACRDAIACAALGDLPTWVMDRYAAVLARRQASERVSRDSPGR